MQYNLLKSLTCSASGSEMLSSIFELQQRAVPRFILTVASSILRSTNNSTKCGNNNNNNNKALLLYFLCSILLGILSLVFYHKNTDFSLMAELAPIDHRYFGSDASFAATTTTTINHTTTTTTMKHEEYDWQRSTEENHKLEVQPGETVFVGEYSDFRRHLDPTYHKYYSHERQLFQDTIIGSMLGSNKLVYTTTTTTSSSVPDPQWILFTAGVYGAGKSHILQQLQSMDCFPSPREFVAVDADEIRQQLPEFYGYAQDTAGQLTQKEAGMIAEILTDVALSKGSNVLVDGSLKDASWHETYFAMLRQRPQTLRIGILYVTAPQDEIYERVRTRNQLTDRIIPLDKLEQSFQEVPVSVEKLKAHSDFFFQLFNSQQQPLQMEWTTQTAPMSAIEKKLLKDSCTL